MDCIFCRIARRDAPATILYEDADVVVFPDIHPKAATHLLVVPKRHISSLLDVTAADAPLLGQLLSIAASVALEHGLKAGYKVVVNTGPEGGQEIDHLHLHVLGGPPTE